ncbi:MAG TPA: trigger factor [Bacillota bacterium]
MQTNLNKLENNIVALELTAEPQEVDEALDHAYKKIVKKVSVPGFRKGKVPRKVLEAHYGKEVLYEEAMEFLVSKGYYTALLENDLEPIDEPKIEIVQAFEDEKPFVFKAEVEVLPEVQLGEYKGVKVEKTVPVVTAEDVERELQALRERHAELVAVEKAAVEDGDFAVIDFDGYIDGKAFPGGAGQGFTVEVGARRFIPGFEEGLVGMAPGSEKEIVTTFPEDYHNKELAGKEVVFKVKLHDIKQKELPELNDEFAKSLGQAETMAQLREDLQKRMQQAAEHEAEHNFEHAVLDEVVKRAQVEIPEKLVERELDHFLHDIEHDLGHRGIKLEEYLSSVQQTEEEFRQSLRAEAEQRVKTDLVLSSIRKAEGISVTDDEVNKRIEETLLYYPERQRTELRKRMRRPQVAEGIKSSLLREKTIKYLVEKAEPVQKEEDSDKVVEAK